MRAAVCSPGAVHVGDVEKPVPKDDEVLVRVHATTICAADYRLAGAPYLIGWIMGLWGRKKPGILGMELSGTVESVGKAVTRFRPGDQVFGGSGFNFGAHAEYARSPETRLEIKPVNMMLEEAAAVPFGGFTALYFLRKAKIQAGQNVLIYGASGSVGVFAVQLAKHFGARVTGVCSAANLEMVKSLGADQVVDYTKEDFSNAGRVYDMIVDTVGYAPFRSIRRALKRGCTFVGIGAPGGANWFHTIWSILQAVPLQMWMSVSGAAKNIGGVTKPEPGDLALLKTLIEAGQLRTVIDRRYPLEQTAEAYRYAETGHKKGHVVILLEPTSREVAA
jgi:NADPH:quinone reductase-like Zn-dependent oxidoreductase